MKFYDWDKTCSYASYITAVVGARGIGKTFGARLRCFRDWEKNGNRFVEIFRTKDERDEVIEGYFNKPVEKGMIDACYEFKTMKGNIYARKWSSPAHDREEDTATNWELVAYTAALSVANREKRKPFANVKTILFDEFIIDRRISPHARYMPNEYLAFVEVLDSILREEPGKPTDTRIFMMANACDLLNPYFTAWQINHAPKEGYQWIKKGDILLHYAGSEEYAEAKRNTLVGRIGLGLNESSISNKLVGADDRFIGKKTPNAKFRFAFYFEGETFGVWYDDTDSKTYVCGKVPKNPPRYTTFALSFADGSPDRKIMQRSSSLLRMVKYGVYSSSVWYDTPGRREHFGELMKCVGIG